jgi:hypothetical protein
MFKNLKKFEIRDALAWLDMSPELGPKARILLAPATEANPSYYSAMLKMSGKRVRRLAKMDNITAEDAQQSRDEDRVLYPLFVIRGWENFEGDDAVDLDENGHVPFNRRNAQLLCDELPPHMMDRLRNEASTPERFYPEDEITPPDADELAEN